MEQPITTSRALLAALITSAENESSDPSSSDAAAAVKQLATAVVDKIASRAVSYEDQLVRACEFLSGVYTREGLYARAADSLARISDLESGMKQVDSRIKLDMYLKVCHLYLMDGNSMSDADGFLRKAMSLLGGLDEGKIEDRGLILRYLSCSARILDGRYRFSEAAAKYLDLSKKMGASGVGAVLDMGRGRALESAVACALLSDAGPQRSRLLAQLYKDDEVKAMGAYPILEKVFLDRLLEGDDVDAFRHALGDQDRGQMGRWGLDVVQLAIVQHNLLACSKLYKNVEIGSLARLFGVDEELTTAVVSAMVGEGRLIGAEIDQVDGVVSFDVDVAGEEDDVGALSSNHAEEAIALADAALAKVAARYGDAVTI